MLIHLLFFVCDGFKIWFGVVSAAGKLERFLSDIDFT